MSLIAKRANMTGRAVVVHGECGMLILAGSGAGQACRCTRRASLPSCKASYGFLVLVLIGSQPGPAKVECTEGTGAATKVVENRSDSLHLIGNRRRAAKLALGALHSTPAGTLTGFDSPDRAPGSCSGGVAREGREVD